mgnify:CR=1 FL=1
MAKKELREEDQLLFKTLAERIKKYPDLLENARLLLNELNISLESDVAKKWASVIRSTGAAFVAGKINPDRFIGLDPTIITPPLI